MKKFSILQRIVHAFHNTLSNRDFTKNALMLMSGTMLAQALPIAITPILTRIYTPSNFGVTALYMSIVAILTIVATAQYENAIMLPQEDDKAYNVSALCLGINICISLIIFGIIFFLHNDILMLFGHPMFGIWIYAIPLSVFLKGVVNSLNYWFIRKKGFKTLATNNIAQSVVHSVASTGFGFFRMGFPGLMLATLFGQLTIATRLLHLFKKNYHPVSRKECLLLAKRYQNFPRIMLAHGIFSSLSTQMPLLLITAFFNTMTTGFYFLANQVAAVPAKIISQAFYQVFFHEFLHASNRKQLFKKKFRQVNLIFIPIFVILWFFIPWLFNIIFSQEWRIAGAYVQILLPLLYFKFLSNLFASTAYIFYEKQMENFLLGVTITILITLSLCVGFLVGSVKMGLSLMVVTNALVISIKLHRSYYFVCQEKINVRCL